MTRIDLDRFVRIANQRILRPLYWDSGGLDKTVFLAGVGRSGTTWIQNLINNDDSYRIMFEPFYKLKTSLLDAWVEHQYVAPENQEMRFIEPARRILQGRIRSLWVDKFNTQRLVRKRIIKDIRAGLFLGWLHKQFRQVPIVLAMRNPFAVIRSQMRANWDVDVACYLDQPALMADHLHPWADDLAKATTPFERNFFRWCIENYVPLKQFQSGDILVVTYEECCEEPENVNEGLCAFLNRKHRPLTAAQISQPSVVTRPGSAIATGGQLLKPASDMFDREEIETGMRILELFGLDAVYDAMPKPKIPGAKILDLF